MLSASRKINQLRATRQIQPCGIFDFVLFAASPDALEARSYFSLPEQKKNHFMFVYRETWAINVDGGEDLMSKIKLDG